MNKILIRHVESQDAELLRAITACPEVYGNTLQLPYPSQELWQERVKPCPGRHPLVACIDDAVAGHLVLDVEQNARRSHVATFGVSVDSAMKNKGIATALMNEMLKLCDKWLQIKHIELTVFTDNASAVKLYQKLGFIIEGTGDKYAFRDGEYVSVYFMARTL